VTWKGRIGIATGALLLAATSFGAGVKYGFGLGADTTWKLSNQNRVNHALWSVRVALEGLGTAEPSVHRRNSQRVLQVALTELGTYGPEVSDFWRCSVSDQETMRDLRAYLQAHPVPDDNNFAPYMRVGAAFCGDD
jgi:hypothetical protein